MAQTKEIDLRRLGSALLKKIWVIVLCTVIAALTVFIYTDKVVTKEYKATVSIYVTNRSAGSQSGFISSSDLATSQRLVVTYINVLTSDYVLDEVAAQITREELTANQLRGMIEAESPDETEVLYISVVNEDRKLAKEIANKKDEYDKVKYQEWLATSVPPTTKPKKPSHPSGGTNTSTVSGITWKVPIKYTAFTSPYGYRTHPVYGGKRFHYGVDLAAPKGTPIYATRAGTVTIAKYDSSAGNYVQINHGDGYKSVYMHMTKDTVSVGQYVSQGQVIGYCGSTGASTGPHLHFGISYNGNYVNPANYIKI